MPLTTDDPCDWCYGPLTEGDLNSRLGRALGGAEAGACADCVKARLVVRPPDSLEVKPTEVPGEVAWAVAVLAALSDEEASDEPAALTLRLVAGYE